MYIAHLRTPPLALNSWHEQYFSVHETNHGANETMSGRPGAAKLGSPTRSGD